jgi:hypothetical protein
MHLSFSTKLQSIHKSEIDIGAILFECFYIPYLDVYITTSELKEKSNRQLYIYFATILKSYSTKLGWYYWHEEFYKHKK